jgi:prolyl 4-hydroxylase
MCDFIGEFSNIYSGCDDMIRIFEENSAMHSAGKIHDTDGVGVVDPTFKISTDFSIGDYIQTENAEHEVVKGFMSSLQKAINAYTEIFEDVDDIPPFYGTFPQIQKYKPNEGFFKWHLERGISNYNRVFAYITYLNDVEDGGGTEFKYFNKTTKAEAGKTIIFPSDWTHMHRGVVSPTETKYIATGWLIADKSNLSFTD